MKENDQPKGASEQAEVEVPKPMDNRTKWIIAGTGAMAISFFLPWIDVWVGSFAPSRLLKSGFDGMTPGLLIFTGTFLLAAMVCFRSFAGKEDTKLTLLAGPSHSSLGSGRS
tara:strand:+ start:105 stop:440 length:336 start_codon:yes stop_codon:yes gene_type:complete